MLFIHWNNIYLASWIYFMGKPKQKLKNSKVYLKLVIKNRWPLKFFKDLLYIAFECLMEKASHDRQKCQLLIQPWHLQRKMGILTGLWSLTLTTEKNWPIFHLPPGLCPNCGNYGLLSLFCLSKAGKCNLMPYSEPESWLWT